MGQVGQSLKYIGFDTFAFFYFQQVLGLDAHLAGLAVALALVCDAISDPAMGLLSDRWRSSVGRRHPFMLGSIVPMSVAWILLFLPPPHLGQWGLFAWLLTFSVLIRSAMTTFGVPYSALGAELTQDYDERTSLASYRNLSGLIGGTATIMLAYAWCFPEVPGLANPLLNGDGYPKFALMSGFIIAASLAVSSFGTLDQISRLPVAGEKPVALAVGDDLRTLLRHRTFLALFVGLTLSGMGAGMSSTLGTHMSVFFWELDPSRLVFIPGVYLLGAVLGASSTPALQRRFDKKPVTLVAGLVAGCVPCLGVGLKLLGWFPENGSGAQLILILLGGGIASFAGTVSAVVGSSMAADVAQEYDLRRGSAKAGVVFAAMSFSAKLASSGGHLLAGLGLQWIAFPERVSDPSLVEPDRIRLLGLLSLTASCLGTSSLVVYRYYDLSREKHAALTGALKRREELRAEGRTPVRRVV